VYATTVMEAHSYTNYTRNLKKKETENVRSDIAR